ncbi:SSD1 protein [Butyriboletus roseoflavus]|nr:SSD1 protein [Butyriboletus roseoflavus]
MTDDFTLNQPKDDAKKSTSAPSVSRGSKRTPSNVRPSSAAGNLPGAPRPSSRTGNKKSATPAAGGTESGSETGKKPMDTKKSDLPRNKSQSGTGQRNGNHRNRQPSSSQANRSSAAKDRPSMSQSSSPAPASASESSDALSSLQRVIADLKTTPSQVSLPNNSLAASMHAPQVPGSNLPANAPIFHPGASAFPASTLSDAARHRKAASLGASALSGNFNSFSPHLGAMIEDVEDGTGASFEDGEISETFYPNSGHQARSQSQSFMAPRFAALAAQQEQDVLGPTGRPQLAPNFMFGARRRASSNVPMGPLNEESVGFQFPQQQNAPSESVVHDQNHRRAENDITGIMAEQIAIQTQIEALQQQQQALYQQQLASNQVLSLQTPGLAPNRHRRVQSTLPVSIAGNNVGFTPPMGQFSSMANLGISPDSQPAGLPRGHGRRHSVNVVNKASTSQGNVGSVSFPYSGQDSFEDGFTPPFGSHSRAASRVDSSWRISVYQTSVESHVADLSDADGGVIQSNNNNNAFAADLAQAQAQLQSLQQFRAAAGGHHHKMPSFSFPNMLPNMMAANMMGLASLPPLLAAGKLVVGILRVNKRNRSDAYVATEVLDADIYICGSKDRNRALEGDIVAVELLDVDEVWGTKKEKEEKKRKKEENSAYDLKTSAGRKDDKKKDDVEVEGQGLMLFEDEEYDKLKIIQSYITLTFVHRVTDDVKPQFAGHVVAVVERMPGQLFSGTLGLLRPSSAATKEKQEAERREREGDRGDEPRRGPIERPKIVWFKPTDKRVPLIAIPTEQAPADFVQNPEVYADRLFVACIKRHPISSLHPFGTLAEELGPIGDIEVETSALLKDCNFPTEEFSESVLKCLPPTPWTVPEREYEIRKDLREERIFTIDPDSAKDLDDALSIKANDDVPMLPPTLSEEVCSLVPGAERLTFSAIFTMTSEGKVVNKWFGKTIIRSAAKLSYADAKKAINGQALTELYVLPEHSVSAIEDDVRALHDIANQLRVKRHQDGALSLSSSRLSFTLDGTGLPTDCAQGDRNDANELVEEFMLLTNIAIAQRIAVHLPEQALLRRHDSPIERRLNVFSERAKRLGIDVDTSTPGAVMKSFEAIANPTARIVLELLSFKATQRAKYFCAGMLDIAKYGHYALNVPLYTHFTSPIRRYADILVHRQLESVLQGGGDPKFTMDRDAVAKIAQQCNIKRDSAKLAQEQSTHLFLCVFISDLTHRYGPVVRQAKVVNVLDAAFDVLVPEFGIEKRVHVDQMPIDNHVYDEHTHTLQIYWSSKDVITWLAENSDDEHLKKVKQNAEAHAAKMEVASRSLHDENALFDEDDDEEDEIVLGRDSEMIKEIYTSKQRQLSAAKVEPVFEGLRTTSSGHKIQDIKELMTVPVIVTADLTKSPPVIKVYSVNPYAELKSEQKN